VIHDTPEEEDGFRLLIDKSWPEGLSEEKAKVDLWLKEIAPTKDIDEWPEDDPTRFDEFKEEYLDELRKKKTLIKIIRDTDKEKGTITFLYSTTNHEHNAAAVLKDKLRGYKTPGVTSSCS
jgi:uncharacterized protein YeaO (DUF488 family)